MRSAALLESARYGHFAEGERMTGVQILAAVLTLGLLVYLTIALLKPEQFQ
jgi:K+-transporting ATPase KdpF subunit